MGFEEIPHTADWAVRVWAADLPGLLAESAHAMNILAGVKTAPEGRNTRSLELEATDPESLLVALLSELLYIQEQENLALEHFDIHVDVDHLSATAESAPIASIDKLIKAVTWHNLKIKLTEWGLEVVIVFDV